MRSPQLNNDTPPEPLDAIDAAAAPGAERLEGLTDSESAVPSPYHAELPRPAETVDAYVMVRQALRGRYLQFVALSMLGAAVGAAAGWKAGRPMFTSEAQVRIAYATPPVAVETDQNKWLGPYDTVMRSQEQVITSRPIVEKALQDPEWKALGLASDAAAVRNFQNNLSAGRLGVTEHIRVGYASEIPEVATVGVNAVVRAYLAEHEAKVQRSEEERRGKLRNEAHEIEGRIAELEAKVKSTSQDFGVPDIEVLYTNTERRVALLEQKTIEVQMMLSALRLGRAAAPAAVPAAVGADGAPAAFTPLTAAEIASGGDLLMRQYLGEQVRISEEIEQKRVAGLLEGHAAVKALRQSQKSTNDRIEAYAAEYNRTQALLARYPSGYSTGAPGGASTGGAATGAGKGTGAGTGTGTAMGTAGAATGTGALANGAVANGAVMNLPAESINADLAMFQRLLDDAKTTLASLAPKRNQVQLLKNHADKLREEVTRLEGRQSVLELESLPSGRVEMIEPGDVPQVPSADSRKKYAVAGAFGGCVLPAGLVVLFGLLNRRYRYSDEAETQLSRSAPLLGILPSLPSRVVDPEQAAAAAQCVHQIRVMLQVSGGPGRHRRTVYLLTSATPGEGKTSVSVSLGLSFAASGSRALVIDCDLIGQRVTRGFNLGGVAGLREALRAGTIRGYARKTASGLWVVPVGGTADVLDACAVSSSEMKRLLADARRYFDTIVIDSGPILGSVEATTVAPQADGVIFCVSRGQQPPLVEKALRHLDSIGAPVAGFVFNRAAAKDFSRSAHASSLRSIPAEGLPTRAMMSDGDLAGRFGPLVQSVVSLLPTSREYVMPKGSGANGAGDADGESPMSQEPVAAGA